MKTGMDLQAMDLKEIYRLVFPIVSRAMKTIRLKTWTSDDYRQEAMMILHQLIEDGCPEPQLRVHFKVKYRQRLIDEVRRNNAKKRFLESSNSIDIYEYADQIRGSIHSPEENIVYDNLLPELYETLSLKYQKLLMKQMNGEKLSRMEKHRLKNKIKDILFNDFD